MDLNTNQTLLVHQEEDVEAIRAAKDTTIMLEDSTDMANLTDKEASRESLLNSKPTMLLPRTEINVNAGTMAAAILPQRRRTIHRRRSLSTNNKELCPKPVEKP